MINTIGMDEMAKPETPPRTAKQHVDGDQADVRHDGAKQRARFSYEGLDRAIHEKARLGIMTSLISHPDGLAFSDLKKLCDLTDGNLSRHLQVLEEANFVRVEKGYEGRRPHTSCRLTDHGRQRFSAYLDTLEQVVRDAAMAAPTGKSRKTKPKLA